MLRWFHMTPHIQYLTNIFQLWMITIEINAFVPQITSMQLDWRLPLDILPSKSNGSHTNCIEFITKSWHPNTTWNRQFWVDDMLTFNWIAWVFTKPFLSSRGARYWWFTIQNHFSKLVEIWFQEDRWFPKALISGLGKSVQKNLIFLLKWLYNFYKVKSNLKVTLSDKVTKV